MAISKNRPLSSGRKNQTGCAVAFLSLFIVLGLLGFVLIFVKPVLKVVSARSWTPVTCRILSSQVGVHSGRKGTTYSVDIVFSYRVAGALYTSSQYQFMTGSSSGYAAKERVVESYRPGNRTTCYVNPQNPADAVIVRWFTPEMLFGLLPLLFTLMGVFGIIAIVKSIGRKGAKAWEPGSISHKQQFGAASTGPLDMKPTVSRIGKLGAVTFFALFWNGLISLFVYHLVAEWRFHHDWFLALFLTPFVLVGILVAGAMVGAFFSLFNPPERLRLTPGALKPGADFSLEWEIPRGGSRLSQLRVILECEEQAVYQSGKETSTARQLCYRDDLVNTMSRDELGGGSVKGQIPSDVMHSLNTGHNKIVWRIRVSGKVRHWMGIEDTFPVVMLPAGWKEGA